MARRASASQPALEVLQGICHAFGSATELSEVVEAAPRWVEAALGVDLVSARVNPLRLVAPPDQEEGDVSRSLTIRKPRIIDDPRRGPDVVRALIPLVCRGESTGVLEIVAGREAIEDRWDTLQAIGSQTAMVLRNLRDRDRMELETHLFRESSRLATSLMRARGPKDATRRALALHFEMRNRPILGWLLHPAAAEGAQEFIAAHGVSRTARSIVREEPPPLSRWSSLNSRQKGRVRQALAETLGVDEVSVLHAGDAAIVVADSAREPYTRSVVHLLREVLRHLRASERADDLDRNLAQGIAWTAHEFRTPLLGARAAIERVITSDGGTPSGDDLLRRSQEELEQLSRLVETLLPWALGRGSLAFRDVDLEEVIDGAVRTCGLVDGDRPLEVELPARATIHGDPELLQGALSNVLLNAMAYSPQGTPVRIGVGIDRDQVIVEVVDKGPGIPPSERERIFEPFVRGTRGAKDPSSGAGLGLYIARRVVEAHGGDIRAKDSGNGGACLVFSLPARR